MSHTVRLVLGRAANEAERAAAAEANAQQGVAMKRVDNVACGSVWARLGRGAIAIIAAGSIAACNGGAEGDAGGGPVGSGTGAGRDAGAVVTLPGVSIVDGG